MSRLANYSEDEKRRIKNLACKFIEGQILSGKLECTDEAIRAAMPQAVEDARKTVVAVDEFLCG
jgi:hypothetical protein